MYERGTVTAIDGDTITIKCGKPEQCKACSSSFCNIRTKSFKALNRDSISLAEGDSVEVYVSPARTIAYSFTVLIFPLLMFVAAYFLTGSVFNISSDAIQALGGAAGLGVGFVISFVFNLFAKKRNLPVITEKI